MVLLPLEWGVLDDFAYHEIEKSRTVDEWSARQEISDILVEDFPRIGGVLVEEWARLMTLSSDELSMFRAMQTHRRLQDLDIGIGTGSQSVPGVWDLDKLGYRDGLDNQQGYEEEVDLNHVSIGDAAGELERRLEKARKKIEKSSLIELPKSNRSDLVLVPGRNQGLKAYRARLEAEAKFAFGWHILTPREYNSFKAKARQNDFIARQNRVILASEEITYTDMSGNDMWIAISHGCNYLSSHYLRKALSNLLQGGYGSLQNEVINYMLLGSTPTGIVDTYTVDSSADLEYIDGIAEPFIVFISSRYANSSRTSVEKSQQIKNSPLMVVRAGGVESVENALEGAKNVGYKYIGQGHQPSKHLNILKQLPNIAFMAGYLDGSIFPQPLNQEVQYIMKK